MQTLAPKLMAMQVSISVFQKTHDSTISYILIILSFIMFLVSALILGLK